jgi:hypothetical protein
MSDRQDFFDKLKGMFSSFFSGSSKADATESPKPESQKAEAVKASTPESQTFTLTALDVTATIINFARQRCGNDYKPQIEVESLFTIGPTKDRTGSRKMVEWFMSTRPGLVLMVMPQPGSCQVILAHGPNPPNKDAYLLGLSPADTQEVPNTVSALRELLEEYIRQGKIAWENGKWHCRE